MNPRHVQRFILAAVWCALLTPAGADEIVPRSEIRQNLFSACFSSDQDGWVVGELGRIYHTTDGGKTFSRSDAGTRVAFLSVACLPDGTVVVTGQKGLAMRSRDQGKTWHKLDTGVKRDLLSVKFSTPQVGVAVGDFGTMVRTEDGGKTWTKIDLPTDMVLPEDVADIIEPGDVLLYDVEFPTPEQGWAVGEFGIILTTADGGKTWHGAEEPGGDDVVRRPFHRRQHGLATGIEEVILHTTDGGANWRKIYVPGRKGFVLGHLRRRGAGQGRLGDRRQRLAAAHDRRRRDLGRVDLPIKLAANWFRGIALTPSTAGSSSAARARSCSPTATSIRN